MIVAASGKVRVGAATAHTRLAGRGGDLMLVQLPHVLRALGLFDARVE
jgi:hypothetical protein